MLQYESRCFVTIRNKINTGFMDMIAGGHLTKNNPQPVEFVTHGIH